MTALALSQAGKRVAQIEKSDDTGRTSAAIHVDEWLLHRLICAERS